MMRSVKTNKALLLAEVTRPLRVERRQNLWQERYHSNFIKDRGLFEAFKEFIAPAKRAIKTAIEEKKQRSAEQDKIRREVILEKKVKHSQAR